jgi:hypothetical protein
MRSFGKFPNIQDWKPGDVLLVSSVEPDWITRKIISIQQKFYAPDHARWQHAAIYMGNGFVAEATTRGVRYESIHKYVGHYLLSVRRFPKLEPDQRWLIAIEAGVRLRAAYGFRDILTIYRRSFPGLARQIQPNIVLQANSVICSQLCYDAHMGVEKIIVPSATKRPIVPAALSLTSYLEDVPTYW